jgi:hypothetical protein
LRRVFHNHEVDDRGKVVPVSNISSAVCEVASSILGGGQIDQLLVVLHLECFFDRFVVESGEKGLLGGKPVVECLNVRDAERLHGLAEGSCTALHFQSTLVLGDEIECLQMEQIDINSRVGKTKMDSQREA